MQEDGGKKKKGKKAKEETNEAVKEEKKPAPTVAKAKVLLFLIDWEMCNEIIVGSEGGG